MAVVPADESGLEAQLAKAIASYAASWAPVDEELYGLCRRRGRHDNFTDVYTKVAMIGRVYEAGVARAWRGEGDPESVISEVLLENADLIKHSLDRLVGRPFDRQTAAQIVELHGHIARAISHRTKGVFLASFVSKYLHFHCPIIPIYDSNAQAAIGRFVDRDLVNPIRDAMAELPEWALVYRNFVAAFVVLHQRAHEETDRKPTVKELDYLLWQPS